MLNHFRFPRRDSAIAHRLIVRGRKTFAGPFVNLLALQIQTYSSE